MLQSNYGAEHAKGPVALSFVSKQGGRDFHGSVFGQLRDYHLNSNEWYANKMETERLKDRFVYPGFTLSGPLLVPGTGFNRDRDRVFFFLGFEYFRQRLDTGWVALVGPDGGHAQRRLQPGGLARPHGDLREHRPERLPGRDHPAGGVGPGRQDPPGPLPAAERRPGADGRLQLRQELPVGPERLAGARPRGREPLRGDEAVRPVQHAARAAAVRGQPLGPVVATGRRPTRRRCTATTARTR